MPINSKQKGARFERQLASRLREYGYPARRTAQYCGNTGDASEYGCYRLGARIFDLKNQGYEITGAIECVKNRYGETCHIKRYRLEEGGASRESAIG